MYDTEGHPSFTVQPAAEASVWRYMDLARYLSMLDSEALHMARADQMEDTWEGAVGAANLEARPAWYGDGYASMASMMAGMRSTMRQMIHLNCWHMSEVESAAMWSIYQREGRGVAVRTTWGRLTASIEDERTVYGAAVRYVDYATTVIPEGIVFDAFLHKRESFAHEREARLVMLSGKSVPNPNRDPGANEQDQMIQVPEEPVIPIKVNLSTLVERVYVAPRAPTWVADVVHASTAKFGYDFEIRHSDLDRDPVE